MHFCVCARAHAHTIVLCVDVFVFSYNKEAEKRKKVHAIMVKRVNKKEETKKRAKRGVVWQSKRFP